MKSTRNASKYANFKYNNDVADLLNNVTLNEVDIKRINKMKWDITHKYIMKDLYILAVKYKMSTYQLSVIYDVGARTIQMWLKTLGINRSLKQASKIRNKKNSKVKLDEIAKENLQQKRKNKISKYKDKQYALYRFLDKNKNILYIGKCAKSTVSNGHGGERVYFIKDRLRVHFSQSVTYIPRSLYLNIKYIEVAFPNVNSNEELEDLESALVRFYEREKLWCYYNRDINVKYTILEDTQEWEQLYELTDNDIDILKNRYGYEDIPSIEIINQRLDSMLFVMDKYNISH